MSDLLLDTDGDLVIGDDLALTSGVTTGMQAVSLRMQSFKEEWAFDLNYGIDNFRGEKWGLPRIRAEFRRMLIETPEIEKVEELIVMFEGSTRALNVSWVVVISGELASGRLDI